MELPLVSIVLPTFNGSKFLRQSVDSCLSQTYEKWELIIVNDCSTDTTAKIAVEYAQKDARIKVIHNKENLKLPNSLNKGFLEAKGDLFTWTSDDNFYASHAIETMVDALIKNHEYYLVYADETLINDENETIGVRVLNDVAMSIIKWKGCGACFLYKKEMQFTLKGYDPSRQLIEDYDFFLRGFLQFKKYLYLTRSDLYFYRFHPKSLTSKFMVYVNDLQKMVLERNKLQIIELGGKQDAILLYRKLAVYHNISKHNYSESENNLKELSKISKKHWLITLFYIQLLGLLNYFKSLISFIKSLVTQFFS